jgi:LPS-assembly protein
LPEGNRAYFQPTISYPIIHPGWYVTPKVIFNAAQYNMDAGTNTPGAPNTLSRAIPTVSLDSGMTFERDAPGISKLFGVNYTQTLEPRLFYVYAVPRPEPVPAVRYGAVGLQLRPDFHREPVQR